MSKNQLLDYSPSKTEVPLSFMYLNARSLIKKMKLLETIVASDHPDVIAITETWASPDTPDGLYSLPGHKLYRVDRQEKRGGGAMVYVKNDSVMIRSSAFVAVGRLACGLA